MRCRSAITLGRSGGRSRRRVCRLPPLRNVVRAWSTRTGTSEGSGVTDRVPASMRPASSRSRIRLHMCSACSSMSRKNGSISAGGGTGEAPSTVAVEPRIEVSGIRNSWLTMSRNSDRKRSSSSSGLRSCRVTTMDSTSPSPDRIGVALTSVRTRRPSGTSRTISSARTVSPVLRACVMPSLSRETSWPSARRKVRTSKTCSREPPGRRRPSTIRFASRLNDTIRPARALKTTTPTGEVSTRASRSARARCSLRYARALAIAVAACEANIIRISSSSLVNSPPLSFSPTKKLPTSTSRCRIGVPWNVFVRAGIEEKPRDRT